MEISPWILAVLVGNLVIGFVLGWATRFLLGGNSPGEDSPPAVEPSRPNVEPVEMLHDLARNTAACSTEMLEYQRRLQGGADEEQSPLVNSIQQTSRSYQGRLEADVTQVARMAAKGDAVLRQVLEELVKHSSDVDRFNRILDDNLNKSSFEELRSLLGAAIAELLDSNRNLEAELHTARHELERQRSELAEARREARVDPLTGVANRRGFDERHREAHSLYRRKQEQYAIAVADIDWFKQLNDTYGHTAGDAALKVLARLLVESVRPYDFVARVGGEEFALLMKCASAKEARIIAKRARERIEAASVRCGTEEIQFTISIGVALADAGESRQDVFQRADAALYAAKINGRNRIEFAGDAGSGNKSSSAPSETPAENAPLEPVTTP